MEEPQELVQELADYLHDRHAKCRESVDFLCGPNDKRADFLPFIYLMWERDFYRNKYLELKKNLGIDGSVFKKGE